MKCKPYSEITVEIRTQLKTVKITSNIFAVQANRVLHSLTERDGVSWGSVVQVRYKESLGQHLLTVLFSIDFNHLPTPVLFWLSL